jgi:hypothetical protein
MFDPDNLLPPDPVGCGTHIYKPDFDMTSTEAGVQGTFILSGRQIQTVTFLLLRTITMKPTSATYSTATQNLVCEGYIPIRISSCVTPAKN